MTGATIETPGRCSMMAPMKFTHSVHYDAPAADVYAMLGDPEFRKKSAASMGVLSIDVSITPAGEGMTLVIDQVQPTEGVPSFARKFAGETTRAIQTERWSGPAGGTIEIETPGKPSSMSGELALSESGGVTTETMSGEVKIKVPLIGGKLEGLMVDLVKRGMDTEHAAGVAWLAGER